MRMSSESRLSGCGASQLMYKARTAAHDALFAAGVVASFARLAFANRCAVATVALGLLEAKRSNKRRRKPWDWIQNTTARDIG